MKLGILVLAIASGGAPLHAQTAAPSDTVPAHYSLLSEHGPVRVLKYAGVPGAMTEMHTHPPHFAYVVKGGLVRFTYPDGQVREALLQAGQTFEIPSPLSHTVEVLGGDTVTIVLVEYRLPPAKPGAAPKTTRP